MRQYWIFILLSVNLASIDAVLARPIPPNPQLTISPKIINFGKVRVGLQRDTFFTVGNPSATTITLDSTRYQDFITSADFTVDSLPGIGHLYKLTQNAVAVHVHFQPTQTGFFSITVPIHALEAPTDSVTLQGIGIAPHVTSHNYDFGPLRVDSVRQVTLTIQNTGSDTTLLDDISRISPPTVSFAIADSVPTSASPQILWTNRETIKTIKIRDSIYYDAVRKKFDTIFISDTLATVRDSVSYLKIRFQPQALGRDSLILRIHTTDAFIYDTIRGEGVEPYLVAQPKSIAFKPIVVTTAAVDAIDTVISVKNIGRYPGQIDSITQTDSAHFKIDILAMGIDPDSSLQLRVTYYDTVEATRTDTIVLHDDTRYSLYGDSTYRPTIIVSGSLQAGEITNTPYMFHDTIRTCDSVFDVVQIQNPYRVGIEIDTITFDSSGAGLSIIAPFEFFPIRIASGSSYPLHLAYNFPPDSLNGPQYITLHLRHTSGDVSSAGTVTVIVNRKRPELSLVADLPTLASSANDVTLLDLPVEVKGPRVGVHELDAWTMTLTFSNDLFLPIDLDATGGLVTKHDTTPFLLNYGWDPTSRTFTITTSGAKLSDTLSRFNDLLFKIRMRAFLTPDTEVTVTPVLKFVQYPCAYTLHPFILRIPYANDCGDLVLRGFMTADTIPLQILPVSPNPVPPGSPVHVRMRVASGANLRITTYDAAGRRFGRSERTLESGVNDVAIPSDLLPPSGIAEVLIEEFSQSGTLVSRQAMKIIVQAQ